MGWWSKDKIQETLHRQLTKAFESVNENALLTGSWPEREYDRLTQGMPADEKKNFIDTHGIPLGYFR